MLQSAIRVPDHGKRVPFRFLRITGDARLALGGLLEARTRERDPHAGDAILQKERERFSFAPLIVTTPESGVPPWIMYFFMLYPLG